MDQHGQVIGGYLSGRRDVAAAGQFFTTALSTHSEPDEVETDLALALAQLIAALLAAAFHDTERYANTRVERDHGRFKARLRSG